MNNQQQSNHTLQLIYFRVTDVWKHFCEEHTNLLDITFEEYSLLLSSDIDGIEKLMTIKNEIMARISSLENVRERLIEELNIYLNGNKQKSVDSISELISVMSHFEDANNAHHLERFNKLLIDIIEKLQTQNKKNQLFLNKSINSLREIREETLGLKTYSTYNNKGVSSKGAC